MKKKLSEQPIVENVIYLIRWTLFAVAAGIIGGVLGGAFARGIHEVTALRLNHPWMIWLLPLWGIVIVWLYHVTGEEKNRGVNMVLSSISAKETVTKPTGPLIFVSTILSHLGGASVGREGAALQLGGWLGFYLGKFARLDEKDRRTAIMCGMSALFAALFGTPVAAAIFCIEVISVGVFYYASLVPCVFSAFIGTWIARKLGSGPETWQILSVPQMTPGNLGLAVLLGLFCAALAVVMVIAIHGSERLAKRLLKNPYLRAAAAGLLFALLTVLLRTTDYTGSGSGLIDAAISEDVHPEAFVLKLLFTCIAIAGGFRGGEIVPTLSIGASFGALFGMLTGFPVSLGAACGMIALFTGATNCPIASLLIAMEMFRGAGLPYFMITVSLSFILSGYYGLYGSQRFVYSKTKNEYIGTKSGK